MARFKKGESGNPAGKPRGCSDWRSKLRKQIEDAAPDLIERLIASAEGGDVAAIKLLLDKVLPNVKPESLPVNLNISQQDEAGRALAVFQAVTKGEVSPDVGNDLIQAISALVKIKEGSELLKRVEELEKLVNGGAGHGI